MKKGLKILALGAAVLGLGCIGLAGCGSDGTTVSAEEFTAFYEAETTSNEMASSYKIKVTSGTITTYDGLVQLTTSEDGVTSYGAYLTYYDYNSLSSVSAYLKDECVYYPASTTYSTYSVSENMYIYAVLNSYNSVDGALSGMIDLENLESGVTIKMSESDNTVTYKLTLKDYQFTTYGMTYTMNGTIKLVYEDAQITEVSCDMSMTYAGVTASSTFSLVATNETITYPDFTNYTTAA